MTVKEAIDGRISRRSFIKNRPLEEEHIKKLSDVIQYYNDISGLHMQLLTGEPAAFSTKRRTLFFFSNVTSYMCLAGQPEDEEKAGYYGEKIVLICRSLGIDTCWVGGTYDRVRCPCSLEQGEMLYGVIALGYAENTMTRKERFIRTFTKLLNQLSAKLKIQNMRYTKPGRTPPCGLCQALTRQSAHPLHLTKNLCCLCGTVTTPPPLFQTGKPQQYWTYTYIY